LSVPLFQSELFISQKPEIMKHISAWISILLLIAGLNSSLTAQPQYYNYNTTGNGNSFPFNVSGKDCQFLFLPGEFSQPSPAPSGNITSISFMINSTLGPATYTTFTIQMGQTSATVFNGTSFYTGSLTTVYNHASVSLSGATGTWMTILLDTPFPYDPTQSLVIDVGQCGATGTLGSGSMSYINVTGNRRNWSVGGCTFAFYGANTVIYAMGISLVTSGPPICVTTAATAVTGISASLNGTVNANGASTTVTFDYGLTTAYGTTVPGVPPTVSGSTATAVTAAIAGLTPNTLYHYRVNGVNGSGTTNGNDMSFTTGPPPPTVVTTAATGIGLNTATVNGTVNANSGSTTVTFQYGLTIAYGSTVAGVPSPVGGTTVTNVSAALAGLLGNSTYHYRVVGVSAGGTSNGNDMTFTTAGPPIVVTTPAMNITHTSATLNGTVTANYLSTTVRFNWGLTAAYGNSITATPTPVTGNTSTPVSANLTGLTDLTTYHYQCVGVNAGGTNLGTDLTFQTGCTPPGTPGTISGPVQVCQGGSGYVYSIAPIPLATSYVWTVPVGATITAGSGTNSITVSFSPTALYGFVTVAGIGSCGNGTAGSLTVSVFTAASPTITGPATTCQGSSNNIYRTQFGFNNYTWTITGGTITSGQGTYSASVTWNNSGAQTISVNYANQNGCFAPTPTVYNVTVNTIPAPTISGTGNLCVNSGSYNYITQSGFSNYIWTVSSGGTIITGQGTSILLASWNTSGAQTVSVNYSNGNGCTALSPVVFPVTVNPVPGPAGPITGNSTVCAGATGIVYSVGSVQNATAYAWNLPPGATNSTGATTNSITVDFASNATSGNITVSGNNTCGNGAPSPAFPVTVASLPGAAGTITGLATVCQGATNVVYTVPTISGATSYTWTIPSGATIMSGSSTNSITVDFSASAVSGNITVVGTNSCGNGTLSPNFAVTVHVIPVTPVVTNTGTTLYSSAPTGNQWYFEGTLLTGATAQTYVATQDGYYWSVVTLLGCASDSSNHKLILTTGIDSHNSTSINLYPVPNDGRFNVSITTTSDETFNISVYNSLGVKIYEEAKVEVNGSLNKVIDLRPVPNGVYTVIFKDSQQQVVKKIIVSK
jgi:hypothetical protein